MENYDFSKIREHRGKSIRLKCLECCCYSYTEVKNCTCTDCPLYPYRMGKADKKTKLTSIQTKEWIKRG